MKDARKACIENIQSLKIETKNFASTLKKLVEEINNMHCMCQVQDLKREMYLVNFYCEMCLKPYKQNIKK